MLRQSVFFGVALNIFPGPVGEGADLDGRSAPIEEIHVRATLALSTPQAREISLHAIRSGRKRSHLPDMTAKLALSEAKVEQIPAMRLHHRADFVRLRPDSLHADSVSLL